MGEYVWTTVAIGGRIASQAIADKLAEFGEDFSEGDNEGAVAEALASGLPVTFCGEVNFGNPRELLAFCMANGLAFHSTWAAKCGAFGSGSAYWYPDMAAPAECDADDDGQPVVTVKDLQRAAARGDTLAVVLEEFKRAFVEDIPALVLEAATAEG